MLSIVYGVAGGLAIFLYGMRLCSEGLQKASGAALKGIIHRLTSHPILGVAVGAVVTILMQSSSATTVILVGFVGASLMTLKQSIGVILGADVGTTVTVQLIAFNITSYALFIIAIGFAIQFLSKRRHYRHVGQIVFGFGMIFFGMGIMAQSMDPLRTYPAAEELFLSFAAHPLLGVFVAALFTALIQGSAATIGIVLSLSVQGLIALEAAIPLILGANIGTCATALLSTIGASTEAKRVGVAHVLFKVLGVLILLPLINPFTSWVGATAGSITRQIANAHTFFNLGITVAFLPFSGQFARLVEKMVPDGSAPTALGTPQYLDRRTIESPLVALEQARAEVLRVASLTESMVGHVGALFVSRDENLHQEVLDTEEAVDTLYREIILFLSDISEHDLSESESRANLFWIQVINDLEHIGDVVTRMAQIITSKVHQGLTFSDVGWSELLEFHQTIASLMGSMVSMLATQDRDEIQDLFEKTGQAVAQENELRVSHIRRLQARMEVSRGSSSVHLDLINCLRRIAEHIDVVTRHTAASLGQTDGSPQVPSGSATATETATVHQLRGI